METLKRFKNNTRLLAYSLAPADFLTSEALPFLTALLFGTYFLPKAAFTGQSLYCVFPVMALGFLDAVWCAGKLGSLVAAGLGAAIGSAAAGQYFGAVGTVLLVGAAALLKKQRINDVYRHAVLLLSLLLLLPLGILLKAWRPISAELVAAHLAACGLTLLIAIVDTAALRAAVRIGTRRVVSDAMLAAISAFAGLIAIAFAGARPLSVGLGAAFLAYFCMTAADAKGITGVACAAIAVAMRVFGANGDLLLIAVLCTCTLLACMLRSFGKLGTTVGFAVPAIAFYAAVHGTGTLKLPELLLAVGLFLLTPKRVSELAGELHASVRTERLEERLNYQSDKLAALSEVLNRLASLFDTEAEPADGFINRQLVGVAESLHRLTAPITEVRRRRFDLSAGSALKAKAGCPETGDSVLIREIDGALLAAISDGMGSGSAAKRESSQAVQLLADLVTCGFKLEEAAECVNRLLLLREGGEIYATLDAMLFDPVNGTVNIVKLGAPPSYIIRGGKVGTLYAEALPVGIIAEARAAVCSYLMRRGDTVVMLSDGAADAFGDTLEKALGESSGDEDPALTAELLVSIAAKLGDGRDDAAAIVIRSA